MLNESFCRTPDYPLLNPQLFPVEQTQNIVYGRILPAVCLIGVLGNAFIFATFSHVSSKYSRYPSLDLVLKLLCVYDILVIFCSLWFFYIPTFEDLKDFMDDSFPYSVPYVYPILHTALTGSDYLTILVVMERLLSIDGRFRECQTWTSGLTKECIKKYILAIVIFTIGFNIPLFFETRINADVIPVEVIETDIKCHPVYYKLYRLTLELLIFKITTWCGLGIMFYSLQEKLSFYTSTKRRSLLNIKQVAQLRDSRISLGLVGLFFLTNALPLGISIAHILLFDLDRDVIRIGNLLLVFNSSLKFLVYIICSPNIRHRIVDFILHPCTNYYPERSHVVFHTERSQAFLSPLEVTLSHLDRYTMTKEVDNKGN